MTWSHIVLGGASAAAMAMIGSAALAQAGPPDGSTPEQKALVAGDPRFKPQALTLQPAPSRGAPQTLFNGRDLTGWDSWLGPADAASTYSPKPGAPIGLNHDTNHVFSVVQEDGRPAILASVKVFGGLLTKKPYSNYHLRLQYKWGPNTWIPGFPRNNGILYHSHGPYGAFFGSWMSAVEFEIVPHTVGMLLTVGTSRPGRSFDGVDWHVGGRVAVGHDAALPYPSRRYMLGGRVVDVRFPAYNVDAGVDAEKPIGSWNTLDLYVLGDRSIHVVNGVPVLAAEGLTTVDTPGGTPRPLTSGRIQLQSEGAETYFRDITIEPIDRLPRIVMRKP